MSGLMVTFKANPAHLAVALGTEGAGRQSGESVGINVGINVGDVLTATQKEVVALLEADAHATAHEMASRLGIAQRNVERAIASLKKAGKLSRVGARKTGHWKVLK